MNAAAPAERSRALANNGGGGGGSRTLVKARDAPGPGYIGGQIPDSGNEVVWALSYWGPFAEY